MSRPGPPYSPEFRAEAVRRLSSGATVAELSRELGVSEQTLRAWRRRAAGGGETVAAAPAPDQVSGAARPRRSPLDPRGEDRYVRRLAKLTAEVIDVSVAVVTAPAKWAASSLRWYADHGGVPPRGTRGTSSGADAGGDAAAE